MRFAAVLAAGSSSRLGVSKQLLRSGDVPLVVVALRALYEADFDRVAVVLGCDAGLVSEALETRPVQRLFNAHWQEGIASSVRCAAAWASGERAASLCLSVCDQPLLRSRHVRALCDLHAGRANIAVASEYAGVRGVPAVFGEAWFPRLRALTGNRGAGVLLRGPEDIVALPWPDGAVDIDTPEDVERVAEVLRTGGLPP